MFLLFIITGRGTETSALLLAFVANEILDGIGMVLLSISPKKIRDRLFISSVWPMMRWD